MVSGRVTSFMARGSSFLRMGRIILVLFCRVLRMERAGIAITTDASIRARSRTTKRMAWVSIMIRFRVTSTMASGRMMCRMARASKNSKMAHTTKANFFTASSLVLATMSVTPAFMKESFLTATFTAMEYSLT